MQFEHEVCQAPVVPARAHGVREPDEAGFGLGVGGLQHRLQREAAQLQRAVLVHDGEVRGYAGPARVLAQQAGAEAVYRPYLRPAHQRALAPEPLGAGVSRRAGGDLLRDAAAQLRRRRRRKRDDQEVLDTAWRVAGADPAHEPLGEHAGLAAARRRRDQQLPAPVLDGQLLRGRGFEFSHFPRLLPACPTRAWRSVWADSAACRCPRPRRNGRPRRIRTRGRRCPARSCSRGRR